MTMTYRVNLLLVGLFFSFFHPQFAKCEIYSNGKYTVDISVYNSNAFPVINSKTRVTFRSKAIYILTSAPGYESYRESIAPGSQTFFKRDIRLKDPKKIFFGTDKNGVRLDSVYFQNSQFGCGASEYLVTACIPVNQWPDPSVSKVFMHDIFWGRNIPFRGSVETVEDYYFVKIYIKREALDWTELAICVVFDTRKKMDENGHKYWLKQIATFEKHESSNNVSELTEKIFSQMDSDILSSIDENEIPQSVKKLIEIKNKFDILHRENRD
ncbi:MAG: hypothetical protein HQM10_24880 [Candidatus Riflebacteria bacterium]|nr:hypothetical protein [Candidatus Riflebacteria bacterium]